MRHEVHGFHIGWLAGWAVTFALYDLDLALWQQVALVVSVYFLARLSLEIIRREI